MTARATYAVGPPSSSATIETWLASPATYSPQPSRVEVIETHISHVFLTERYAFKLKKPVHFEFLDFRQPEQRRQACEEEVRLNRRLAKDVYLGVVPITNQNGRFAFDGEGPVADWVVKMRRLPSSRAMDQLICSGAITNDDVRHVARALADFYSQSPPVSVRCEEYRHSIEHHVVANNAELARPVHQFSPDIVRRVLQAQLRVLRLWPDLLATRVCDGRIVDGHGDLRPEHIYLLPQPTIIDCIEFNADFRRLDVVDELCFLDVECTRQDAEWIGASIISHYRAHCRDDAPDALLSFYRCYRACVRAKVTALRAEQLEGDDQQAERRFAATYLDLANRYAGEFARPMLLVVCGLSGSGKSTLAQPIAERLGFEWLQSDAMRREVGHSKPARGVGANERYSVESRNRTYDATFQRAEALLTKGVSVLLDATFIEPEKREQAAGLAETCDADVHFVHCTCPESLALARIAARHDEGSALSEATPDVHKLQRREADWSFGGLPNTTIDTTESLPDMTERVFAKIRQTTGLRRP